MNEFIKITDGIYRLKVPFEELYTSVFLVEFDGGRALVDCATTSEDVDGYIIPALEKMGISPKEVEYIVITHGHGDHAGGLPRILELMPSITVICGEVCEISPGISTYPIPGHTLDFIGVFDERSGTLISGDGLQGAGVDKYRTSTKDSGAYLRSLEKIRRDERVENLLFSHAYEPWFKDRIFGRDGVLSALSICAEYVKI